MSSDDRHKPAHRKPHRSTNAASSFGRRSIRKRLRTVLILILGAAGPLGGTGSLAQLGLPPVLAANAASITNSRPMSNAVNLTKPASAPGVNQPTGSPPAKSVQPQPPGDLFTTQTMPMNPGLVSLDPTVDGRFLGSDGRFEVDVPAGAVSATDIAAAGGQLNLSVKQIAPASGGTGGGSGHYSFGTFLVQTVDGQKHEWPNPLRKPLTFKLHMSPAEHVLGLQHTYLVFNGSFPTKTNFNPDPAGPAVSAAQAKLSPSTALGAAYDKSTDTLAATSMMAVDPTVSFNTDSPVATFGKPDIFNADLNAGALSATFPIDVPSGPGGFKPPIALGYSSAATTEQHNPQGAAPWVGEGWNLNLGSISWAEHNVAGSQGAPNWQSTWQLNDAFGTQSELIPPTTSVATFCGSNPTPPSGLPLEWHTALENHAEILEYTGQVQLPCPVGSNATVPCFRVFLTNGVMEEFGCLPGSIQWYPLSNGSDAINQWMLDLIVDPHGNQIRLDYQPDNQTTPYHTPRDLELSSISWDDPTCHNPQVACSNWRPLMQVSFAASKSVAHPAGATCPPNGSLRCDDPVDLGGSGGLGSPAIQNTFVLNDILVQLRASPTATWKTLRDYQLGYEQSGPGTIPDPVTGLQQSTAGKLNLTQIVEVGDDAGGVSQTTLPARTFTYQTLTSFYEDERHTAVGNCGPGWNTGCLLWSQSYAGNSSYLASATNGMGLKETFGWDLARNNTHVQNGDPLYCNLHVSPVCNKADSGNWSRIVLVNRDGSVLATTGGSAVTGKTTYGYWLTAFWAFPCSDCTVGYNWGDVTDQDYLDYYNGKFMGFAETDVTNPDLSYEVHTFYSTAGWGIYDCAQLSCAADNGTNHTGCPSNGCSADAWWSFNNAAHGHEGGSYVYTDSTKQHALRIRTASFNPICPPTRVQQTTGGSPPNGYGTWDGQLVGELDPRNPIAVCDVQATQSDDYMFDGQGSGATTTTDKTVAYTYDNRGRVSKQTTTSNDGVTGSATTLVRQPTYLTIDTLNHTAVPPVGSYVMDPRTFDDAEDGNGNRLTCSYMTYNASVDLTETDRYAGCGTAPSFNDKSGKIATTYVYDAYGNRVASTSPDGNAPTAPGVSGTHTNCTTPAVSGTFSSCASFDSTFQALQTSQANAVQPTPQTSTVDYPAAASATAANGFGLWPQSTTDINGQKNAVAYDALGREITSTSPGESAGLATSTTAYANWCSGSVAQAPCVEIDRAQRLSAGTGGTYIPLPPTRICDTRSGNGTLCAGRTLMANTVTTVQVTGQGGVPNSGVAAVVLNAAVLNSPGSGFLVAFPTGTTQPATSNLNYYAGQIIANLIQVPVGSSGQVSVYAGLSNTDLVLDVQGYVPQNWSGTAGLINPLIPNARICDTRSASVTGYTTPCTGRTIGAGASLAVQVTGQGGIPANGVAAAVLNVTVVNTVAPGALTVFATGQLQPGTANLNWNAGQVIGNRVLASIGSSGQVTLVNQSAGTVDVIVDANAWVTDGSSPTATGAVYSTVTASRICDTRSGTGTSCSGQTLAAGAVLTVPVAGTAGIPPMGGPGAPQAVNINVTVANPSSSGAIVVYPDGTSAPTTSDLNFATQQSLANLDVVAAVGSTGKVDIYNRSSGTVDLIIDIGGYYGTGSSGMVTSRSFFDGWGNFVEIRAPGPDSQHDVVRYRSYDKSNRLVAESVPYYVTAYAGPPSAAAFTNPDRTQATTSYTYDGIGRVLSTADARGKTTSTNYSIVCNAPQMDVACYEQIQTVDPLGHRRGTAVDALGRIAYEQRFTGNSPSTYAVYASSSYTYDAAGNLLTIFHPSNAGQTTYTYDAAGRRTLVVDPDTGRTSYSYDPDGNTYQVVDARNAAGTSFTGYDNIDRPTWRDTQNSGATAFTTFTYDGGTNGKGHRTGETFKGGVNNSLSGTYAYTFDVRGRSLSSTLNISGQPYTVTNGYDDAGNLTSQTYPNQETVTTALGATGWLASVGTQPASGAPIPLLSNPAFAYSPTTNPSQFGGPAGQMTSAVLGANFQYSATYDALVRPTELKLNTGSTTYFDQQRAFDDAGNVTTANTTVPGGTDNQAFCYDEQDRLTWAGSTGTPPCQTLSAGTLTAANYTQSFAYDRLGRLTSGPLGAYSYDPNHLHAANAIGSAYTATYDASGNMTCRAPSGGATCVGTQTGAQLSYNAAGALTAWQNAPNTPAATAGFLYDGEGNRVEQQVTQGGTTTTTVYIGNLEQVAVTGGTTTTTTYYYANSLRIALAVNGAISYVASDGLGSANVAIKATDSSTGAALYAPYGQVRYSSGTMPTDYGFTGQHADAATGLDYYNARYYDPLTGQFTSPDALLPGGGYKLRGLSRYAYTEGNPETWADPSGHAVPDEEARCATTNVCPDKPSDPPSVSVSPGSQQDSTTTHPPQTFNPCGYGTEVAGCNAELGVSLGYYSGNPFYADAQSCHADAACNEVGSQISGLGLLFVPGPDFLEALGITEKAGGFFGKLFGLVGRGAAKGKIPDVIPYNLAQKLALDEARANPGTIIIRNLADEPRLVANYGPGEWVKAQYVHVGPDGNYVVHYFENLTTGQRVQFKFTSVGS